MPEGRTIAREYTTAAIATRISKTGDMPNNK